MGSDVGRIVRAAGVAKNHERINFFFIRTHQDGTSRCSHVKYQDGTTGELGATRRPTSVPLDRKKFPLTLADGLRTTFADVVAIPLPAQLAALNLPAGRLRGGARPWGKHNRHAALY